VGLGSGAVGTGLLETEASQRRGPANVAGPGAGPDHAHDQWKTVNVTVDAARDVARRHAQLLDLTGAKRACDRGVCGSCTVIHGGQDRVQLQRPGH